MLDSQLRASSDKRYGLGAHRGRLNIQVGRVCVAFVRCLARAWRACAVCMVCAWQMQCMYGVCVAYV